MAESVDSLALAVERSNIFAIPEGGGAAEFGGEPARTIGVFAARSSSADRGEAAACSRRRRWRPRAAGRRVAPGVSTRSSVCLAAAVAAAVAGLVLHEVDAQRPELPTSRSERSTGGVDPAPARAAAANHRAAERTAERPVGHGASRRRFRVRRPRVAPRRKTCCRAVESRQRPAAAAPPTGRSAVPASPPAPATPVEPSRAPASPQHRAAPAPVPAGTPPEFM